MMCKLVISNLREYNTTFPAGCQEEIFVFAKKYF